MNSDSPATPADSQPAHDDRNQQPEVQVSEPIQPANEAAAPPVEVESVTASTEPAPEVSATEPIAAPRTAAAPRPGSTPLRERIQIGSRRGPAGPPVRSNKPRVAHKPQPVAKEAAQAAAAVASESHAATLPESLPIEVVAPVRADIPKPSRRDPLTPEMEAELYAAMGDVSLDNVVTAAGEQQASRSLELETRLRASIVRIEGDNVFFGLTGRNEGFTSVRNFVEPPAVGTILDVVLNRFNAEDGLYEVLVPGATISVGDWSDLTEGAIVEARVTAINTGGLECQVNNIRGFMPSSQVAMYRVEDFSEYVDQKLPCVVVEVNERKRNLVLSHRAYLEREREESRKKLLAEIAVGDVREGVVSNIKDFGAFVDLGGIDGMIHISQLSWERVKHPSEVVQPGQKVSVRVEKINPETGKISLSYRDLLDHPWTDIEQKLPIGTTVKGPVTRIAKFGAFVRLSPGVEGLVHISELTHHRIRSVGDIVKEGEEVEVKILSIDSEAQRIALSLKATLPEPQAEKEVEEEAEAPAEFVVARRKGPLKGGFDRPNGGASVGLNW